MSRPKTKINNDGTVVRLGCLELGWRSMINHSCIAMWFWFGQIGCRCANKFCVVSAMPASETFLTGCWNFFWIYFAIGLTFYGRWNGENDFGRSTNCRERELKLLGRIWDVWGCFCTSGLFYFLFSSCTVTDDFGVCADVFVPFCDCRKGVTSGRTMKYFICAG